ncbi:MAG: diguanylate cyclase, partial [Bacteroidota bacterium]
MGSNKKYDGYRSFQYLEKDVDYKYFELAEELNRVSSSKVPLTETQEEVVERILKDQILISVHEHLGVFPENIMETPAYIKEGRMATGFKGLAQSHW